MDWREAISCRGKHILARIYLMPGSVYNKSQKIHIYESHLVWHDSSTGVISVVVELSLLANTSLLFSAVSVVFSYVVILVIRRGLELVSTSINVFPDDDVSIGVSVTVVVNVDVAGVPCVGVVVVFDVVVNGVVTVVDVVSVVGLLVVKCVVVDIVVVVVDVVVPTVVDVV